MNLDKWYKSRVEGNSEIPPESVWEGVQDALDVDMVWERVESALGTSKKKSLLTIISIAASFLIAFGVAGTIYYLSFLPQSTSHLVEIQLSPIDSVYANSVVAVPQVPKRVYLIAQDFEATGSIMLIDDDASLNVQKKEEDEERIASLLVQISPTTNNVRIPVEIINIKPIEVSIMSTQPLAYRGSTFGVKSLYVGLTGHIANTWLLSSKTLTGLQPDDLTRTNITFGSNVGVQLGAEITQSLKFQAEFLWISKNKQQYNEYLNGKYVASELELDYYTLTLQGKYHFSKNHTIILGCYFGLMKTAIQNIGNEAYVLNNDYSNYDYGLIVGYEYPIPLGRKFTFSPGLFAKVGLNNVFAGNEFIPFYLNKTQNASFNLSFSVAYNIF